MRMKRSSIYGVGRGAERSCGDKQGLGKVMLCLVKDQAVNEGISLLIELGISAGSQRDRPRFLILSEKLIAREKPSLDCGCRGRAFFYVKC